MALRVVRILLALYGALCIFALWLIPASLNSWFGVERDPLSAVFAIALALPWSLPISMLGSLGTELLMTLMGFCMLLNGVIVWALAKHLLS